MIRIFLPAYKEQIALPRLIEKMDVVFKLEKEEYKIYVLDDGSPDKTYETAQTLSQKYPMEVMRHEKNQGLGITMLDGLKRVAAVSSDDDLVVTLDCDDTHEPQYLPEAIRKIREGADVVALSRYCAGGNQEGLSAIKTFLSAGAGVFLKLFFPIRGVREYSCNYRVYRATIIKKAFQTFGDDFMRLTHLGFAVSPEILIKMRMLGARIVEAPFVLKYQQKPTPSTNRSLKTIQGYFALVWNFWGRSA